MMTILGVIWLVCSLSMIGILAWEDGYLQRGAILLTLLSGPGALLAAWRQRYGATTALDRWMKARVWDGRPRRSR